jgi:hypothetical protein
MRMRPVQSVLHATWEDLWDQYLRENDNRVAQMERNHVSPSATDTGAVYAPSQPPYFTRLWYGVRYFFAELARRIRLVWYRFLFGQE